MALVVGVLDPVIVDPVAERALVRAYLAGNLGDRTRGVDHKANRFRLELGVNFRRFSRINVPPFRTGPYWSAIRNVEARRAKLQCSMWPTAVVVGGVPDKDMPQVPLAE